MFDQTDLNLRYRAHAERVDRINRVNRVNPVNSVNRDSLAVPLARTRHGRTRVLAADVLLWLSAWLAPEELERVALDKGVTV